MRKLLFLFLFLGSFFVGDSVFAGFYQQPDLDTIHNRTGTNSLVAGRQNFFPQSWTSSTAAIEYMAVSFRTNNQSCVTSLNLTFNTGEGGACGNFVLESSNFVTTTANEPGVFEFNFDTSSVCNDVSQLSSFHLDTDASGLGTCIGGAANDGAWYGSSNTSTWAFGGYDDANDSDLKQLYFLMIDENGAFQEPVSSVDFEPPISPLQCPFLNWQVNLSLHNDDVDELDIPDIVGVVTQYGLAPGILSFTDIVGVSVPEEGFISRAQTFIPVGAEWPDEAVLYARTCLCTHFDENECEDVDDANLIACSETYEFIIDPACDPNNPQFAQGNVASSTPSIGVDIEACEEVEGLITGGMCRLFTFLFVPNQKALDNFVDLKNRLSSKPPFGYFSLYNNAIDTLTDETGSATSTISAVGIESGLELVHEIDFLENVYTAIQWLLYIVFLVWVFNRIRKLIL